MVINIFKYRSANREFPSRGKGGKRKMGKPIEPAINDNIQNHDHDNIHGHDFSYLSIIHEYVLIAFKYSCLSSFPLNG